MGSISRGDGRLRRTLFARREGIAQWRPGGIGGNTERPQNPKRDMVYGSGALIALRRAAARMGRKSPGKVATRRLARVVLRCDTKALPPTSSEVTSSICPADAELGGESRPRIPITQTCPTCPAGGSSVRHHGRAPFHGGTPQPKLAPGEGPPARRACRSGLSGLTGEANAGPSCEARGRLRNAYRA